MSLTEKIKTLYRASPLAQKVAQAYQRTPIAQKVVYAYQHTPYAFADLAMTLPIRTVELGFSATDKALAATQRVSGVDMTSSRSSLTETLEEMERESPVHQARTAFRAKHYATHDTAPTAGFLCDYLTGTPPYYFAASYLSTKMGEFADTLGLGKFGHDTVVTWGSFIGAVLGSYAIMAGVHAMTHPEKFRKTNEDGSTSFSPSKVWDFFTASVSGYAAAEVPYNSCRDPLQRSFMHAGSSEATASKIADGVMMPAWFGVVVLPVAFAKGLVHNKQSIEKGWVTPDASYDLIETL